MKKISTPNQSILKNLLTDNERYVVYYSFGLLTKDPLSLSETANRMGIGKETVRRIKIRAINKLKESPEVRELFKDFI
jgi:DNA-directed RNA polymerase sigma subunit (sigma70/sigma32)